MPSMAMEQSSSSSFSGQEQTNRREEEQQQQQQQLYDNDTKHHQQQSDESGACFLEDAISLSTSSSNPTPETPLYVNVPNRTSHLSQQYNNEMLPYPPMFPRISGTAGASASLTLSQINSRLQTDASRIGSQFNDGNTTKTDSASGGGDDVWAMMDLGSDSSSRGSQEQDHHDDDPQMTASHQDGLYTTASSANLRLQDFPMSPEPFPQSDSAPCLPLKDQHEQLHEQTAEHRYHLLCQIQEDRVANNLLDDSNKTKPTPLLVVHEQQSSNLPPLSPIGSPLRRSVTAPLSSSAHLHDTEQYKSTYFVPQYTCTKIAYAISKRVFEHEDFAVATWLGFWALLNVTCANYVLSPMRDAVALHVGVKHIPKLTLASSLLAFLSSVPIGWLFEAPDPNRRKVWKKVGLTRGDTQGTSLALFYRFFAVCVLLYAVGFQLVDMIQTKGGMEWIFGNWNKTRSEDAVSSWTMVLWNSVPYWLTKLGSFLYVAFFLVMHLMKLHSISLVWGVTTEAMDYEDVARKQQETRRKSSSPSSLNLPELPPTKTKTRLQRLALVGFGGTIGGVWGSVLASSMAKILHLPGLLVLSAYLLEVSAELSIELGRIMQKHWEDQQIFQSTTDLTSLDPSMKRSTSLGSMKRISSGNSLYAAHQESMKRVASGNSINRPIISPSKSLTELSSHHNTNESSTPIAKRGAVNAAIPEMVANDTFTQRLLRGTTTILKSRLLMAIFTYNALFASTSVLLSFQRAELVANRNESTTVSADTAFLANINMASSIAVFLFQASGIGAIIAQKCGSRGSLSLMPLIRLAGLLSLCWWHRSTNGQPPNLIIFLMIDECTRVVNLAITKPVRESLWRGLSNEARYEAKPIVDTLANRWGAGSASFCVSVVSRVLLFLGQSKNINSKGEPMVLGLPPVLFLGLIVAAWWLGVSFDLGHIRRRIDIELKKHQ